MRVHSFTEIGRRREGNEDALWFREGLGFFAVADGVGGLATGEAAARLVVEAAASVLRDDPMLAGDGAAWIDRVLERANREIVTRGEGRERAHGATAVLASLRGGTLRYAWIGDSRLYLLRGGKLRLLTADHSRFQELVARGVLRPDRVDPSLRKGALTRCLGFSDVARPDRGEEALREGDRILLCSDGVSDPLDEAALRGILGGGSVEEAVEALRRAVDEAGAPDNATAILVELDEEDLATERDVDAAGVLEALAEERKDFAVTAVEGRRAGRPRSLAAFFGGLRRASGKRLALEGLLLAAFVAVGFFLPEIIELFGRKLERVAGGTTIIVGILLWLAVLRLRLR